MPWGWILAIGLLLLVLRGRAAASSPVSGDGLGFDMVVTMSEAIARAEGFGVPGAIPTLRHNPGNLTDFWSGQIATYPDDATGWAMLYDYVGRMLAGTHPRYTLTMTLAQAGQVYARDSGEWANNVAAFLGVSTTTTLAELAAMEG